MSLLDRIIALVKGDKENDSFIAPKVVPNEKPKKIVSTMFNSLTLSSDMQTLYLVDNGRSFNFRLDSQNGIIVGLLDGQISVSTARRLPEIEDEGSSFADASLVPVPPVKVRLDLDDAQYTLFFNLEHDFLGIIGATEIDGALQDDSENIKTSILVYRLRDFTVNVKRKGNFIEIIRISVGITD